ncbi:unnamed protein product [Effrenium voratum]|nr:unnamed protein product [Effrenium voratum]
MECVESSAAPTFFRSLVGSIAFAWYTLGAAGGDFVVKSTRITGFASRLYVTKRLSIQRPPLLVCQIQRLENIVNGNIRKAARDRVAAGFFLFATLARARFSDAMAVEKLELDMTQAGDGFGYVEAATTRSKTSYTLERKTRYLPLAAPAVCLCEGSWARIWIQLMEKTGLQVGKGKPLLPAPGIGGEWSPVPLTASEGAGWLRSLLQVEGTRAEYEQLKKIGTHSCKTTVLSWAAKYGTPHELRLTMGYHSLGAKSKSMYVYGRDNISEALRKEDELLAEIRASRFLPDATRSGYFPGREPAEANKIESEPTSAELRDASSSECSADEEVCQNVDVEEAEEEIAGDWHTVEREPTRAMSYSDSEAVFRNRCAAVLLASDVVDALVAGGITTLARLAFCSSYVPGSTDEGPLVEAIKKCLGRDPGMPEMAGVRRLFHESYALVTTEMKQSVERSEEPAVRKLSQPERAERYEKQRKRLSGLSLRGQLEPSDSLVDLACSIYEENRLRHIPWEKCISREAEIEHEQKKDSRLSFDSQSGRLKIEADDKSVSADMSSDILVQYALTRRGLAMVSLRQCQEADRKLFAELADKTRGGIQGSCTASGKAICFGYNLKTCQEKVERGACRRGLHICAVPKCGQHHAAVDCVHRPQQG